MALSQLTEKTIQQHSSAQSFQRGYDYYQEGAVISLIQRGTLLQAEVEGSEVLPYLVCCLFDSDEDLTATCTCPYDWGGWCKHIIATCLACLHQPEMIEERPPLDSQLARLNRDQLQLLLLKLAEQEPALVRTIEREMTSLGLTSLEPITTAPTPVPPEKSEIDPKAIHRQIRSIIRSQSSESYWEIEAIVRKLGSILEPAWELIKAENGRCALTLLRAILEGCVAEWKHLDDFDRQASQFFSDLTAALAEALLCADLTSQEREWWANQLKSWRKKLGDFVIDESFEMAIAAAVQGWNYPPLVRVLQGNITDKGAWDDEAPDYADELALARLNVLKRRGRWQEYLYLAQAEGQLELYNIMLIHLGRIQQAMDYGLNSVHSPSEALALAQALYEHGESEQSIQMAQHGLTLDGSKADLAKWLRDQALTMGKTQLALTSAERAFYEQLSLENYLQVAQIAGEQWPERREVLLNYLHHTKSLSKDGQVEVFLHEGLIDDAIAVADSSTDYKLRERVVAAALTSRPDWAIQACQRQAEYIINKGQTKYYDRAVNWLEKARTTYRALGREEEWQTYLNGLLSLHWRKSTLVPMLKALS
jgi:uncharacterized Zn finger protein